MTYCTVVNCMDGRVQLPVIEFLKIRFKVDFVDCITEPGPNFILSQNEDVGLIESIFKRIDISVIKHKSSGIAIAGHFDCASNTSHKENQINHLEDSVNVIRERYKNIEIISLWVNKDHQVEEL